LVINIINKNKVVLETHSVINLRQSQHVSVDLQIKNSTTPIEAAFWNIIVETRKKQ